MVQYRLPPILCGCSSTVEHQPSKLDMGVRLPSPAPGSMCCIYIKRLQNGTTCAVPLVGVQMGFTVRRHTTAADDDYVAGSGLNETDATCVGAGLKSSVVRCRYSSAIAE